MTAEITQELAVRMAALVRNIVNYEAVDDIEKPLADEARAIVALLPEPVDPDEAEVLAILTKYYNEHGFPSLAYHAAAGHDSDDFQVGMLILARGRELALKAREGES